MGSVTVPFWWDGVGWEVGVLWYLSTFRPPVWAGLGQSGLVWAGLGQPEPGRAGTDQSEPDRANLSQTGPGCYPPSKPMKTYVFP